MKKIIILLLLFLCSCMTGPEEVMKSWLGLDDAQLLSSWGAPHLETKATDGKRILTYRFDRYNSYNGSNYIATRTFTVDTAGTIIGYSWRGW